MIIKDYSNLGNYTARTLRLGDYDGDAGPVTIKRGPWTVLTTVSIDWYQWANEFSAMNEDGDIVAGDFEHMVIASDQAALDDFLKYFQYEEWDYDDI